MADDVEKPETVQDKPKHPGGRPRVLQSIEAAESLIELYFKKNEEKPTICGLATALGFVDRQSIRDYIEREDEFSCIIKKAVNRIEEFHEKRLFEAQCAGSIFWLKNRGWKDSHDFTSGGEKITPQIVSFGDMRISEGEGADEHTK